jgi:hypothetical protein
MMIDNQTVLGRWCLTVDLERLSEGLFGRGMRLPVLVWIRARGESAFHISEASRATGYAHQHVKKELDTLVDLGFLSAVPTVRRNDPKFFHPEVSYPLWAVADTVTTLVRRGDLEDPRGLAGVIAPCGG